MVGREADFGKCVLDASIPHHRTPKVPKSRPILWRQGFFHFFQLLHPLTSRARSGLGLFSYKIVRIPYTGKGLKHAAVKGMMAINARRFTSLMFPLLLLLLITWLDNGPALWDGELQAVRDDSISQSTLRSQEPLEPFDDLVRILQQRELVDGKQNLLDVLINPFSPILLCNHHFGVTDLPRYAPVTLHPVDMDNARDIAHMDIVCCQTDQLQNFIQTIIPLLENRIILITHKWYKPAVARSNWTDSVRQNHIVAHWFSQNPIYESDDTYSAFPYGIKEINLETFAEALLKYSGIKDTLVQHLYLSQTNVEREILPKRPKVDRDVYYTEVSRAKFLLSPPGDRPDCYRHWEAIGLGTMPISSLNKTLYQPLFGPSMKFVPSVADMLPLLCNSSDTELIYRETSRHFVSFAYWRSRVRQMQLWLMAADE